MAGGQLLDYAPRILIVDDEPDVRTFFDRVLSEDGYCVDAVGTARQALRVLGDRAFELALVDLSLPDGDGVELMRQMRMDAPYLRILATSGFLAGTMADVVLAAGATATLEKPATPNELRNAVYRLLEPSGGWCEPQMSGRLRAIRSKGPRGKHVGSTRHTDGPVMNEGPAATVQVIALLFAEDDRQSLRDICAHSDWQLRFVRTLNELQVGLRNSGIGVVITDTCLPDCDWKEVLDSADGMEGRPRVIVSSRLADDRLWAEVLNLGGFDVLMTPFERAEVLRCVDMAWRRWQDRTIRKRSAAGATTLGASA
jgi:DNA-binding response OmpR family regulator